MECLPIMLFWPVTLTLLIILLTTSHSLIVEESEVSCDGRLKTSGCSKPEKRPGTKTTIYFGLMLSFPDPQGREYLASSFDDGHDIAPAVYLAVKQINNRTDLLKDYDIEILRLDGGCDVTTRTVIGANELICSCKSIVGIIGPSCKLSSKTVGHITNQETFSMITINYGDVTFSNVDEYAYSFGILGASSMYSSVYSELIKHNNWTNYALLYSGSSKIYSRISQELQNLTSVNFQPRYSSAIYDDTFIPLREVKQSYARVTIVIASPPTIARVLCLAYHEGMVFPSYQWVFQEVLKHDLANVSFRYEGRPYSCSDKELNRSVNRSINLFSDAIQDDANVEASVDDIYTNEYESETVKYSKQFGVNATTREWARGLYDAAWALAYALNDSLVDLNMSLAEFRAGSPILAEIVKHHLFDVDFQGITGNISFDNKTGINIGGFLNIFQYTDSQTSVKVGFFKDKVLTILSPNSSHVFIKSSFKEKFITIGGYIIAFILIVTLTTFLLLVSAQTFNIWYRNDKRIKASSPLFNHLIFIGGYAIVAGITVHSLESVVDTTTQLHLCNLVPFLFSVGITLYLGTSCVKTWRLNRIYVHSRRLDVGDILLIKGHILIGFISMLVVMDLLVCIIWRIMDPLIPVLTETLNKIGTEDELVVSIRTSCRSRYGIYWYTALLMPKVVVIIASFFLALSTQMNIKEFKTNNIIILTYFLTVIFGLGIPLYAISIITHVSVSISTIVLSLSFNLTTYVCILTLFLPLIKK